MKRLFTLVSVVALLGNVAVGQTVLTLQPDAAAGKDALIHSNSPGNNFETSQDLSLEAWTYGGSPGETRGLLEFDLSSIPTNATITNADLSLFYVPQGDGDQHSTLSGSNASWVQRITSTWSESAVTWNTKPIVSTQNQVNIPMSTTNTQDYPNLDVTALVQDMIDNPSTSFGFDLRLQNEQEYRRLVFGSSDHPDTTKHPKLEITYTTPIGIKEIASNTTLEVYPNPSYGQFTVRSGQLAQKIEVYDLFGRLVLRSTEPQIDMRGYAKGMYVVKLIGNKETYIQKLILE